MSGFRENKKENREQINNSAHEIYEMVAKYLEEKYRIRQTESNQQYVTFEHRPNGWRHMSVDSFPRRGISQLPEVRAYLVYFRKRKYTILPAVE